MARLINNGLLCSENLYVCTGCSFSEALILRSTNLKFDRNDQFLFKNNWMMADAKQKM